MPSAEQIKQFLLGVVLPPLIGGLATWLYTSVHFLSIFHVGASQIAQAITAVVVFGVTTALTWATHHHILRGSYK